MLIDYDYRPFEAPCEAPGEQATEVLLSRCSQSSGGARVHVRTLRNALKKQLWCHKRMASGLNTDRAVRETFKPRRCRGLNVYVLPKFICWKPNALCAGIWKWGLWKVIRD